ncbi:MULTISPECIES: metal ABC transporter ATP-binding protein [Facklamia]|uniref:Metal ABC transporter ATP-binding protein n=1 Tax=Facklamia hominis TaxID=178214 RepID=A0AAJ1Q5H7_9LACT|nr:MULTISPECIES: metal ABC transporter ATP-binding protein [Facklamia]MDK7186915.1 metal ABC transporter ATP-binding protein [Facklamia hominis]OFL65649.1 zinc ABC transporter ATP-binding protein [Facklamia sp. HMSC062C11]
MEILKVEDLSFYYDQEKVLNQINFTIHEGEFVILTGENGAAKSTLIKNIIGLFKPATGKVYLAPKNSRGGKLSIGYVAQNINAFNAGFPSTVQRFVESGRYSQGRWFKPLDDKDYEHVDRALDAVGMAHLRHRLIGQLSGGQKQKVILARIFALDPDFYVLDEPTAGMDSQSRKSFYRLLQHLTKEHGKTIMMVTHADDEIEGFYDREIRLIREEGSPWRCFSMNSSNEHSLLD